MSIPDPQGGPGLTGVTESRGGALMNGTDAIIGREDILYEGALQT